MTTKKTNQSKSKLTKKELISKIIKKRVDKNSYQTIKKNITKY